VRAYRVRERESAFSGVYTALLLWELSKNGHSHEVHFPDFWCRAHITSFSAPTLTKNTFCEQISEPTHTHTHTPLSLSLSLSFFRFSLSLSLSFSLTLSFYRSLFLYLSFFISLSLSLFLSLSLSLSFFISLSFYLYLSFSLSRSLSSLLSLSKQHDHYHICSGLCEKALEKLIVFLYRIWNLCWYGLLFQRGSRKLKIWFSLSLSLSRSFFVPFFVSLVLSLFSLSLSISLSLSWSLSLSRACCSEHHDHSGL